jgi:hypothetical protein
MCLVHGRFHFLKTEKCYKTLVGLVFELNLIYTWTSKLGNFLLDLKTGWNTIVVFINVSFVIFKFQYQWYGPKIKEDFAAFAFETGKVEIFFYWSLNELFCCYLFLFFSNLSRAVCVPFKVVITCCLIEKCKYMFCYCAIHCAVIMDTLCECLFA